MLENPFFKSAPEQLYEVAQGQLRWITEDKPSRKPLPKIKTASELMVANMEMPAELIHGVLHQGLKGVLASSSKAGKTWLLLDMALSVASGLPWIKFNTTKAKVLVVNFEIPEPFLFDRIRKLTSKKADLGKYDLSNLHLWTLRGFNSSFADLLQEISRTIRNEQYGLVIIDPVYKGLAGADENKAGDVATLCNQFEQLCVETGAALVYAHHFSKGNKAAQHPLDRMSGSGVFARDADSIILLTGHTQPDCYRVELVLRNLPRVEPFVAQWEFPLMVIRQDLDPEDLARKPGRPKQDFREELLEILAETPLRTKEWEEAAVEELGMSESAFDRDKRRLAKDGRAEKVGTKWQVAKTVSKPAILPSEE